LYRNFKVTQQHKTKKMKNIFLSAAFITLCAFGGFAQKIVSLITLGGTDTTVAVYEGLIWKVQDQIGGVSSTVSYVKANGDLASITSNTNELGLVTLTARLFTPAGLGYTINADRVKEAYRLTDSSCLIKYKKGDGSIINININSLSLAQFNAALNAL
jgi:hypothetical protein